MYRKTCIFFMKFDVCNERSYENIDTAIAGKKRINSQKRIMIKTQLLSGLILGALS